MTLQWGAQRERERETEKCKVFRQAWAGFGAFFACRNPDIKNSEGSGLQPRDGKTAPDGFAFDTYGVRVPAVIVTPWIPAGSVLSPLSDGGDYPFDHTSIIKTVRELFGIPVPLTDRDAAAPSLLPYLSLAEPFNEGPTVVIPQNLQPSRAEMQNFGNALPNELLKALGAAAERLDSGFKTIERDTAQVVETVAQIGTRAIAQVTAFLSSL